MRWAARWCGLGVCLWLSVWASAASAGGWEELLREDGVVVSGREVEGRSLPTFRGQGVVEGHLLEVLAVLSDTPRNVEWMHHCQESRMLKQISEFERIIYNRTTAPWPVADRDVVLRSRAEVDTEKRTVLIKFASIQSPLQGEVDGVVRMPSLQGFYKLEALDLKRTRVTYQVDADPGGLLPDWLAARASRELPLHTLRNLRAQVEKTRGQYVERIKGWASLYPDAIEGALKGAGGEK